MPTSSSLRHTSSQESGWFNEQFTAEEGVARSSIMMRHLGATTPVTQVPGAQPAEHNPRRYILVVAVLMLHLVILMLVCKS